MISGLKLIKYLKFRYQPFRLCVDLEKLCINFMVSHKSFNRIVRDSGGVLDTTSHPPPFYELTEMSFAALNQIKDSINKNSNKTGDRPWFQELSNDKIAEQFNKR